MARLYHTKRKGKRKRKRKINAKNYNIILTKTQFSPKNLISRPIDPIDQQNENSTPTSTPIAASNSQDNSFTPIKKLKFSIGSFRIVYRTGNYLMSFTRRIQIYRDTTGIYKYFSQQLSSYKGAGHKSERVPTPFGSITVSYMDNKLHLVDKFVRGGRYSAYKNILGILDKSNYSHEIAKSILEYLETPAIDNFKDFNDVQIEKVKYIDNLSKAESACAKALSAILMISEPSQNRNYGGGMPERAIARKIVDCNCRFSDVINKELYQQMQKGGAKIAKTMIHLSPELAIYSSPQGLDLMDDANEVSLIPPNLPWPATLNNERNFINENKNE